MATGGDSSSTGMDAMISPVFAEIFTSNARSSFGSWVATQSVTPLRASSTTRGEI
jgi:3-isopropylmalate dehydratase small subunit